MKSHLLPDFIVERIEERCNKCGVCVKQCPWGVYSWNDDKTEILIDYTKCVGCQRCVIYCPNNALIVKPYYGSYRPNSYWTKEVILDIKKQAEQGGVLLVGTGSDRPYKVYFDHILLNASQVTNPSIDPLREPMELRTFLGRKPDQLEIEINGDDIEINKDGIVSELGRGNTHTLCRNELRSYKQERISCTCDGRKGVRNDVLHWRRWTSQGHEGRIWIGCDSPVCER